VRFTTGVALILSSLLAPAACGPRGSLDAVDVRPMRATAALPNDPDDPAIWRHPTDPSRSLILGTVKVAAPQGALAVFGLDGRLKQTIGGLDRPNNVDVEYGLSLQGIPTDIAVVTERLKRRLLIFRIDAAGALSELGSPSVLTGEPGEHGAPMGIALYRRPRDGAVFAIVSPKTGPTGGYLWEYRLTDDEHGGIAAVFVRRFGHFSGAGEIEAVAVDDALGYVYYADEDDGIHKWHADPDHPDAARELARFGTTGFTANREGIAVYSLPDGTGYIVCTDQIPGNSEYRIYRREGEPGFPHDHSVLLKVIRGGADSTDGIEVAAGNLGPDFPHGLLVAMNSRARNFLMFGWDDIFRLPSRQSQDRRVRIDGVGSGFRFNSS